MTYADTLARYVIAANGDKIAVGSNSLDYTIGQPFISTDYSSRLTAGFLVRRSEPPSSVKLMAIVSSSPVCLDEPFDVTFQVVTEDSQPVSSMGVYMEFDPAKMKVNSIEGSGKLDFTLTDRFNNNTGYIHFVAGSLMNPPPTGTFDLVTVNFTALEESEDTILHVDPEKSSASFGGEQIPQEADDTTLVIEQCGPKECQVTLQRAHSAPHASWDQTELSISGDITDAVNTDDSGHCELTKSLADGNYVICAKNPRTLRKRIEPTIPLADGSEVIKFGTLLEGDFDDNNILDSNIDFSNIVTLVQLGVYDAKADLNVDGALTPDDVILFYDNYDLRPDGEVELHGETCTPATRKAGFSRMSRDGKPSNGIVSLRTTHIPNGLTEGSTFDLSIQVTQPVQVAGAYLNFHPESLKVNSMTPGNHLDFVLQNYFSNDRGIINYTAGLLEGEIAESSFTLVTLNFTVLAEGGEKTLAFNMTQPRKAHAMFDGESVIAPGQEGSEVIFEDDEDIVIAPATCQLYAVNDKGLNNSQFFTVNLDDLTISALGPLYKGHDIESLAIHPETNMIYAASGDNATSVQKGHFYRVDGETGEISAVGSTHFKEIEDLAFSPDGTLYAWAKGDGLITIDLATGAGTLMLPSNVLIEGLTLSKEANQTIFYGSINAELWMYDMLTGTLNVACNNLLGETEALEIMPDGLLLIGTHNVPFGLHAFDAQSCQIIEADETLSNQYDDVEGIALPVKACGQ
ncbi:MAG: hypothetical protein DRQ49_03895 [Gammaproteobacteria bacterium]|nr:MAG: hypothetical protein DRQ49_03895 [Gammaproteobacteria bacterium]